MKAPADDPLLLHSAATEQERLYEMLGGVLQRLVTRKFEVTQEDAESLVKEAFIAYHGAKVAPNEVEDWVVGAVCRNARKYLQRRGLVAPADVLAEERAGQRVLSQREALAMLPSHAREALRLRFEERKSYPEIAEALDVPIDAAQRLVAKAGAKLRGLLRGR